MAEVTHCGEHFHLNRQSILQVITKAFKLKSSQKSYKHQYSHQLVNLWNEARKLTLSGNYNQAINLINSFDYDDSFDGVTKKTILDNLKTTHAYYLHNRNPINFC